MGGRSSSLDAPDPSGQALPVPDKSAPTNLDKEQILLTMQNDMEYKVDSFSSLSRTCFNKCVDKRYKETELYIGENSCIDRCVAKYWQVTNVIGQILASNRPM